MELIKVHEFKSEVFREYSATPIAEPLGMANHTMSLYMASDKQRGFIEWYVEFEDGENMVEEIGLWFTPHGELTDYDGVFSMPKEAIEFLEKEGYNCDYAKD